MSLKRPNTGLTGHVPGKRPPASRPNLTSSGLDTPTATAIHPRSHAREAEPLMVSQQQHKARSSVVASVIERIHGSMHLLKFSSEDCGTCHRMSHYDAAVAEELGCDFVSVMLQDTETYRKFRKVLLAQYPNKEGMGWPTYLLVDDPEGAFSIHGELKGGMPKGDFRTKLQALLQT